MVYSYECPNGHREDRLVRFHQRDEQKCACGAALKRDEISGGIQLRGEAVKTGTKVRHADGSNGFIPTLGRWI